MSDMVVSVRLKADGSGLVGQVRLSREEAAKLNAELSRVAAAGGTAAGGLEKTRSAGRNASTSLDQVDNSGKAAGLSLKQLGAIATGTYAALQLRGVGQAAIKELAAYQDMRTRLTGLAGDAEGFAREMEYLDAVAEAHGKSLQTLAQGYTGLLVMQQEGILVGKQSRAILEGLSNAQSFTGSTTAQLEQSLYGMQQALSSSTVMMEEVRQVTDPIPGLLGRIAAAAGTTKAGFQELIGSQQVTGKMFGEYLTKALDTYSGAAAAASNNINAQLAKTETQYTKTAARFEQPLGNAFGVYLDGVNSGLELLAENAELVTSIVAGTLAAALARGTVALTASAAAALKKAVASRAAAQAELMAAQAEVNRLTTMTRMAGVYGTTIALENQLTAARIRLATATAAVGTAGRTLLGLFGGWPGLAITAGAALMGYAASANAADEANRELEASTRGVTGAMAELTEAQRQVKVAQANAELSKLRRELASLEIQANSAFRSIGKFTREGDTGTAGLRLYEQLQARMDGIRQRMGQITEEQDRLFDAGMPTLSGGSAAPSGDVLGAGKLTESADDLLAKLKEQIGTYGQVGEAAKVRYQVEFGELKALDSARKQELVAAAERLDQLQREGDLAKAASNYTEQLRRQQAQHELTTESAKLAYELQHGALRGISEQLAAQLRQEAALVDAINAQVAARARHVAEIEREAEAKRAMRAGVDQVQADIIKSQGPVAEENAKHESNVVSLNDYRESLGDYEYAERVRVNELIEAEQQRHARAIEEIERAKQLTILAANEQMFDGLAGMAYAFGGEQSKAFQILFAISKGFAVAQAGLHLAQAISTAQTVEPWYAKFAAIAEATATGASILAQVKGVSYTGQAHDGLARVPAANEGTFLLRKDEMVLNPKQRDNFEYLVNYAKGNGAAGGRTQVTIINQAGAQISERRTRDAQGTEYLEYVITRAREEAVAEVATQMESRSGRVGRAMRRAG